MSVSGREALTMSVSGREALTMSVSCREALSDVREWYRDSLRCPGVVGRPSRMFDSGIEALSDVREW